MVLLIVGATGTLGRQIVRRAIDEGHDVRCLVRNPRKGTFLQEWGAHLVQGDLCDPDSLKAALRGASAVIDAATARPTDALGMRKVDWEGKVALVQAAEAAAVDRFIFFSLMNAEQHPQVPLMDIKACTEQLLKDSQLNYTILRTCGFFQGIISQYAIPILDNQSVWITGAGSPIAFMDTQDIAKFAIKALSLPATEKQTFNLAGPKAWNSQDIIQLCEKLSKQEAKISQVPLGLLRVARRTVRFFQWGWNVADRLAFAEVIASGQPLDAPMDDVYATFEIDPASIGTLEAYLQEYFDRILQKLKEIDYEKKKQKSRKRTPFKAPRSS